MQLNLPAVEETDDPGDIVNVGNTAGIPGVFAEAEDIEGSIDDVMDVDPVESAKSMEPIEATEWPEPNAIVVPSLDADSGDAEDVAENHEDVEATRSGT